MDGPTANRWVMATFFLILALVTAEELFVFHRTPQPSRYLSIAFAWSILGIVATFAPAFAGGLSILTTLAFGVNHAKIFGALPGAGTKPLGKQVAQAGSGPRPKK